MLRVTRYHFILILLYCLPVLTLAQAPGETYINALTGTIKKDDLCEVQDDKFANLTPNEWNRIYNSSVNNLISFELRNDVPIYYYNKLFTCSLNVSIKYYTTKGQTTPQEINNIDLVVKYDPAAGAVNPTIAQYWFKNAFRVIVKINSITSPELGTNIPAIFRLKNQINIDRAYSFTKDITADIQLTPVIGNPADQKLMINWNTSNFPGSADFDVDWTFIDIESQQAKEIQTTYTSNGIVNIPYQVVQNWMQNDYSRVTVTAPPYQINLPYGEGYILARVRGATYYRNPSFRYVSNWAYHGGQGRTAYYLIPNAHAPNLHYQYTAAFAEEGKRKEVVSYFDAGLKERQLVTLNNNYESANQVGNTAIVQETIYDILGRPAVQVMPAPVKSNSLNFLPSVNKSNTGQAFSFRNIDLLSSSSAICGPGAGEMSTVSGASNYYSPQNAFLNPTDLAIYPSTAYVPDADKRPYSLTQYTADNTGRVKRTWAAGGTFQPTGNSAGHSTDYFYGKPAQKELDRLFGSEVGFASHYLKNMVVDPNGQVSVTYLNAAGKTIASALAGAAPKNLEALPSLSNPESATLLKRRVINSQDFRSNTSTLITQASAVFLASQTGKFKVFYDVNPLSVITQHGSPRQPLCNNCYYNVVVEVKNDCGVSVASDISVPFTGNDAVCNPSAPIFTRSFEADVAAIGEYTITYSLQLSEAQIKYQTDYYIQNNTDLKKLQYFFQKELDKLDLVGCYQTCEACTTLGTKETFRSKVLDILNKGSFAGITLTGTEGDALAARIDAIWNTLKSNCDQQPCGVTNSCEMYLEQMKQQVRPGGQYARVDFEKISQTWYLSESGETNLIPLFLNSDIPDLTFTAIDGSTVNRKSLSIHNLIREYQVHPEWADELVKKHVEYCGYEFCKYKGTAPNAVSIEASYDWDQTLREKILSGQDAINKQYFDRSTILALLNKDPFFGPGGEGASLKSDMTLALTNYASTMSLQPKNDAGYPLADKNILQYIDWLLYCKPANPMATNAEIATSWNCSMSAAVCRSATMEWEMYRNFYLQLKSKFFTQVKKAIRPDCLNCFIGNGSMTGNKECSLPIYPCPTKFDFELPVRNERTLQEGCDYDVWDQYVAYKHPSGLKRTAKVKIRRTTRRTNGVVQTNDFTYTLTPIVSETMIAEDATRVTSIHRPQDPVCVFGSESFQILDVTCPPEPPAGCPVDIERAKLYAQKARVFLDYQDIENYKACKANPNPTMPTEAEVTTQTRDGLTQELTQRKANWQERLKQIRDDYSEFSAITDVQITNLTDRLEAVSLKWLAISPRSTMSIANSLPAGQVSANGDNNFAQAFSAVIGSTLVKKGFSHYILENVYPYDKQPVKYNANTADLNSDICTNIATLRSRYAASGFGRTFHEYLKHELEDDYILTEQELADIESRCQANPQCTFTDDYIVKPVVFTKKAVTTDDLFINNTQLTTLENSFQSAFPDMTVATYLYNNTYAAFMNQALGYPLGFTEYQTYKTRQTSNPTAVLYNKPENPLIINDEMACTREQLTRAYERAGQEYDYYITLERKKFRNRYISTCLSVTASSNVEDILREYHYTLYYYDQSGNLVKTIPPEGVRFLSNEEMDEVDKYRNFDPASCNGAGIPTSTDKTATLNSISTLWKAKTSKSLELWLYNNQSGTDRHVRWVTPDASFIFQTAIHNKKLWVELYSIEKDANGVNIILSNQLVADISGFTLQSWSHLVAQSPQFDTDTWTLYLDGKKLTTTPADQTLPYPVDMELDPNGGLPPEDLTALKHVRLYNRLLTDNEVAGNYANSCLNVIPALATVNAPLNHWGRFNIPTAGGETTTGPGSTNEYVYRFFAPKHGLPTNYAYNSTNNIIRQESPDGGASQFWYDRLSRVTASQNAEQKTPSIVGDPANRFSYVKYDALGRTYEAGEKVGGDDVSSVNLFNKAALESWYASGTDREIIETIYDVAPDFKAESMTLENLRQRVSASVYRPSKGVSDYNVTYYSYDISGNAKRIYQEIAGLKAIDPTSGIKQIDYEYDLISGKVNQVSYQKGMPDQFFYKYSYDSENRLLGAFSSRDNNRWEKDASYAYYLHGPLARVELGNAKVQGIDYAYTLSGWLKGINGNHLNNNQDIGNDGIAIPNNVNSETARDELAYTLGYFDGDFKPVKSDALALSREFSPNVTQSGNPYVGTGASLYNGNISNATIHIAPSILGAAKGYTYRYDQLNRIVSMRMHNQIPLTNSSKWDKNSITEDYLEDISYDANGNILKYKRNGFGDDNARKMDDLTYHYETYDGQLKNNKLNYITDAVPNSAYTEDLETQNADNYKYDKIGNLIYEHNGGTNLSPIRWTSFGKIASIKKGSNDPIVYAYNAAGQRVSKSSKTTSEKRTYYVRDAQGNVLAVYDYDAPVNNNGLDGTLKWEEQHLFGSSRLGMWKPGIIKGTAAWKVPAPEPTASQFFEGNKSYELSNHLGNVLAVILDKKKGVDADANGTNDYYAAELVSATDYYPFGMQMPGRKWRLGGYRYGFNGKENDDDVKGEGVQQDYGMRIYDVRVGKFLSVDPITKSYPELTPYQFASNTPIQATDLDGLEAATHIAMAKAGLFGSTTAKIVNGTSDGIEESATATWKFITRDAWKADTWKKAGSALGTFADITFGNLDGRNDQMAYDVIQPKIDNFKKEVVNGDAYSRSKYFAKTGTDVLTAWAGDKGLGLLGKLSWVAPVREGTQIAGFSLFKMGSNLTKKVNEFKLTHSIETITKSADYKAISALSNDELINSVLRPKDYKKVTLNTQTGTLFDGNTRIYELQKRNINIDVPYQEYTPDNTMFPELKEPPKK
ncbi:hypothetical protein HHL16_10325 [Pseudoflavitalea sp. G-6-1-2]|uniref:RHS repeat domain-containing protein n=1 Tax=Pseudoflavitalea sp. G-6-1-2 TaxID=2728841 RepID=UPI00146B23F9|nr:RHS repeat-associated core domain-containing protein [Pseudoflavitalea sp. G-6-1-2]NML21270.1 hypothetical protein [Pseudoflavitalea sp. G-6-1-2]